MRTKLLATSFIYCLPILTATVSNAQYYYNELYTKSQIEKKQLAHKTLKIKKITETAILPDGQMLPTVMQWTDVSKYADTSIHYRSVEGKVTKTIFAYNRTNGNLISKLEIQADTRNETNYFYNDEGTIERVEYLFIDTLMNFKDQEIQIWQFSQNKRPKQMWRLVERGDGAMDTTEIKFEIDEKGRVTAENHYKKGIKTSFYYYYYNENDDITDIVRYYEKWKKLLPDQMMEYNEQGQLIQKRQLVGSGDISYVIWRYDYYQNGLIKEEALFNSKKEHTGSFRFEYDFIETGH